MMLKIKIIFALQAPHLMIKLCWKGSKSSKRPFEQCLKDNVALWKMSKGYWEITSVLHATHLMLKVEIISAHCASPLDEVMLKAEKAQTRLFSWSPLLSICSLLKTLNSYVRGNTMCAVNEM
jgi:hypothetical protein